MKTSLGTVITALALATYAVGCATSGTPQQTLATSAQEKPDAAFYATGVT